MLAQGQLFYLRRCMYDTVVIIDIFGLVIYILLIRTSLPSGAEGLDSSINVRFHWNIIFSYITCLFCYSESQWRIVNEEGSPSVNVLFRR